MAAPQLNVFPVGNYTFGSKLPKFEKDSNVSARMERLKEKCDIGTRGLCT